MKKWYIKIVYLFFLPIVLNAQDCPDCNISLPSTLPENTIYLAPVPDATLGDYYEQHISFRLPQTTDPVAENDPSIPTGLNINSITITSLSGLPAGLKWTPNQTEFLLPEETDGCVSICGIPIEYGTFEMEVRLDAQIAIITQSSSVTLTMTVLPATSNTDGFTISNTVGCGSLEAIFQNNVPSNGQEGYSYAWDFGNGLASTLENPPTQIYDTPGIYPISYEATIDTMGYTLTRVEVLEVGCNDVAIPFVTNGNPDLYIRILDAEGNWLHESPFLDDVAPPVTFDLNIPLQADENYTLVIRDQDGGIDGQDDTCGEINFNIESSGELSNGDVRAELTILHPVTTVTSSDTVYVYETSAAPEVSPTEWDTLCEGNRIVLRVENYMSDIQWYQDGELVGSDIEQEVTNTGIYWASYTNANGCISESESMNIFFNPIPTAPAYTNTNNELELFDSSSLPTNYTLQWSLDGVAIAGATDFYLCAETSGIYMLTVYDEDTGCGNSFSSNVIVNPNYDCTVSTTNIEVSVNLASPNPFETFIRIKTPTLIQRLSLWDVQGRLVLEKPAFSGQQIETTHLDAGFYILKIETAEKIYIQKMIKS